MRGQLAEYLDERDSGKSNAAALKSQKHVLEAEKKQFYVSLPIHA